MCFFLKNDIFSVWSQNTYEIEDVIESHGQNLFRVRGLPKLYLRHELLKI